jgi:pimeloyl-ACP methyl ester carboxylesterase
MALGPRGRIAAALAGAMVVLYGGLVGFIGFRQEGLIFHPVPLPADHAYAVQGLEEVKIPVEGAVLSARHFRLPNPNGVVFFLHGNGGNADSWLTSLNLYRRTNYDLFLLDYRGYGKSTGTIENEEQLHKDVRVAWDSIAARYAGMPNVIYGRSLGTGLAARLAMDLQPALTILVSPYFSLQAMGDEHYPYIPHAVLRYPMRTDLWLPKIASPVMLVHGSADTLIPPAHSRQLHALVPRDELLIVEGAGHNDIHSYPAYFDALAARLLGL